VLRYLPTNLSGPEIAGELYVSHSHQEAAMTALIPRLPRPADRRPGPRGGPPVTSGRRRP